MSIDKSLLAGEGVKRFLVSTSDILEGGQKVYIREEKTGDIKWCKTRTLAFNEIVDEFHSPEPAPDGTLEYSIHRPTRGWYIHIRAQAHSRPLVLAPDPLVDPNGQDADSELVIEFPINSKRPTVTSGSGLESQDEYSFPPTPPTIRSPPPSSRVRPTSGTSSPSTSLAPEAPSTHTDPLRSPDPPTSSTSKSHPTPATPPTLTFLFAPTPPPVLPKQPVFSRAYASGILRVVANTIFNPPRRSFVLSSRTSPNPASGPLPTPVLESAPLSKGRIPVLTFTDTTPVFSVSQMTGVLSVDLGAFGEDGEDVDVGLLVTAAMAYLDFLGDREGYIAAANGG